MFNIGAGEFIVILVVALLILGPKRLPELARGIGKFMREFRRQTDDVRNVVEREFYRMDQELEAPLTPAAASPDATAPADATAAAPHDEQGRILPPPALTPGGMPVPAETLKAPEPAPASAEEPSPDSALRQG